MRMSIQQIADRHTAIHQPHGGIGDDKKDQLIELYEDVLREITYGNTDAPERAEAALGRWHPPVATTAGNGLEVHEPNVNRPLRQP